jgi:PIN domain nuclease of toxin-antitoxin system
LRALTDTNALLWIACSPGRLTGRAKRAIADSDEVWFSIVNIWEIALKLSKGGFHDIDVVTDWSRMLVPRLLDEGFRLLPIQVEHCRRIQTLPFHHKDPFDRMLIAQALEEKLEVIGCDEQFDAYGVRRVW